MLSRHLNRLEIEEHGHGGGNGIGIGSGRERGRGGRRGPLGASGRVPGRVDVATARHRPVDRGLAVIGPVPFLTLTERRGRKQALHPGRVAARPVGEVIHQGHVGRRMIVAVNAEISPVVQPRDTARWTPCGPSPATPRPSLAVAPRSWSVRSPDGRHPLQKDRRRGARARPGGSEWLHDRPLRPVTVK